MKRDFVKKAMLAGAIYVLAAFCLPAEVLFEDTFDRPGPPGWSAWDVWTRGAAFLTQRDGCLVFDRNSTKFAQAAVQSSRSVDVTAYSSVTFKFRIKNFGGDVWGSGIKGGRTSFIVAEHDDSLNSLYSKSGVDGVVFSVEHQSIGHEGKSVVPIEILSMTGASLGRIQVQSTNDFCLVVIASSGRWTLSVENTEFSVMSGTVSGEIGTWGKSAGLRMESWCVAGDMGFGPAAIDAVSIEAVP